jgi:hypothetical protein
MGMVKFHPAGAVRPPETAPPARPLREPVEVPPPRGDGFETPPVSLEDARREVERLNRITRNLGNRLRFGLFEETDQFFVQLIDRRRNEVLRTMPPEHLLHLRQRMQEAVGLILDRQG